VHTVSRDNARAWLSPGLSRPGFASDFVHTHSLDSIPTITVPGDQGHARHGSVTDPALQVLHMDAYDTGLLVINGIGAHPPTQTLDAMMEPLLARMRAEGSLIDTVATQLGDPEGPGGKFDALVVDYRAGDPPENRKLLVVEGRWQGLYRKPDLNKMSAWLYARQGGMILDVVRYLGRTWGTFLLSLTFTLLMATAIVLGGWKPHQRFIDVVAVGTTVVGVAGFVVLAWETRPESAETKSRWHAIPNVVDRPDRLAWLDPGLALVCAALLAGWAGWSLVEPCNLLAVYPLGLALLLAMATSMVGDIRDDFAGRREPGDGSDEGDVGDGHARPFIKTIALAPVFTLLFWVYITMRAVIVVAALFAIVFFWVFVPLLRLLALLPFANRFSWWVFTKFETALFTGGWADMESVLNNHVSTAAMRARLRTALSLLRDEVKCDKPLTVIVHSGGSPLAWDLLSSSWLRDELARSGARHHDLRLVTVAPSLNWARKAMRDRRATMVEGELVPGTKWLNIYSAWDPTPHGETDATISPLWDATALWAPLLDTDEPVTREAATARANLVVRNLGAPVLDEHREYWQNQEQVVPVLVHAIDPDIKWASEQSTKEWRAYWGNVRLGLVSTLVRVRLILVSSIIAVLMSAFSDDGAFHAIVSAPDNMGKLGAAVLPIDVSGVSRSELLKPSNATTQEQGRASTTAASSNDSTTRAQRTLNYLRDHRVAGNVFVVAATILVAYLLMNIYTNLAWALLARRPQPYGVEGSIQEISNFRMTRTRIEQTFVVVCIIPGLLSLFLLALDLSSATRAVLIGVLSAVGLVEFFWLTLSVRAARWVGTESTHWDAYRCAKGRAGNRRLPPGPVHAAGRGAGVSP